MARCALVETVGAALPLPFHLADSQPGEDAHCLLEGAVPRAPGHSIPMNAVKQALNPTMAVHQAGKAADKQCA